MQERPDGILAHQVLRLIYPRDPQDLINEVKASSDITLLLFFRFFLLGLLTGGNGCQRSGI